MSQSEAIHNHLILQGPLTPLQALNLYGCFRLGARILDLRRMGVDIKTRMIKIGKKSFAEYSIEK